MIECLARAKINLALHVTGQRADGYHLLDSLVVFAEFGDLVQIALGSGDNPPISLTLEGPFASGLTVNDDNLVLKAAQALRQQILADGGVPEPVQIRLIKNLPIASGIGGGSADAAATLIALQSLWKSNQNLEMIANTIGADVSMCLHASPMRVQGIGEVLTPLEMPQPLPILLVNPGISVSTPEVFGALVTKTNSPISTNIISAMPSAADMHHTRNDLQNAAISIAPQIQTVLNILRDTRAQIVRMSGSGATCFGVYGSNQEVEQARQQVLELHPDWWVIATQSTVSQA